VKNTGGGVGQRKRLIEGQIGRKFKVRNENRKECFVG
jgi:hypothetical protein